MLLKKTIGIIIIALNLAGIGYLLVTGIMSFISSKRKKTGRLLKSRSAGSRKKPPGQPSTKITRQLEKEDDLLKDMDLSDLDNIDLDDFE